MIKRSNSKWWALGALTLAVLAVGLDSTILSIAIPTLAVTFHATESELQWFSSGYLLVLAASMLPLGLLGDRFGRKKIMLITLLVFGAGSAACAYTTTPGQFIAVRMMLGFAGAGVVVMAISALTVLFSEEERPKAVGIWAAANFLSLPIGPILGGWLLSNYWWGWVFLINVPVAITGCIVALLLIPESRASVPPGLDVVGIAASIAGMGGLTYGLIEAGRYGWTNSNALFLMILGIGISCIFFLWENWLGKRSNGQPLIDLTLFRSSAFTWGVILAAVLVLSMMGVLFTLPQYFQGILGTDAMGSGLRLLPMIAGLIVGALLADRIAGVLGSKITVAFGFLLLAIGMFVGSTTEMSSGNAFLYIWTPAVGIGMGLTLSTTVSSALREISKEQSGVASAVMQALQKMGGPLGTAILGSVLSTVYQNNLPLTGLPISAAASIRSSLFSGIFIAHQLGFAPILLAVQSAFIDGMDASLKVAAGIAVAGIILTLLFLPQRSHIAADAKAATGAADKQTAVL